ncbi:MAG TPA: acylphosphatase [Desulfomonilia bacterium]
MRKFLLFLLLTLYPFCLSAESENPDSGTGIEVKKEKNKVYIQESEIYPYMTIEQDPPIAARRGFIKGDINEASIEASMKKLAAEYNLAGWIKKTPEGTFQFHLQGLPDNVKAAIEKIPTCDPGSKIEGVDSKAAVVTKYMRGFKTIEAENRQGD